MIRSFGFQPFFEGDAGGNSGASAPAPAAAAGARVPAAEGAPAPTDRVAQLERELLDTRAKLTKVEQAEATAKRKADEEQGNFRTLYEASQAALAAAESTRAAEHAAATVRQSQLTAAKAAGIDDSLATRLVGDTPEALLADAKALAARLAPTAPGIGSTNPSATRGAATVEDQINSDWAKRKKGGFRF